MAYTFRWLDTGKALEDTLSAFAMILIHYRTVYTWVTRYSLQTHFPNISHSSLWVPCREMASGDLVKSISILNRRRTFTLLRSCTAFNLRVRMHPLYWSKKRLKHQFLILVPQKGLFDQSKILCIFVHQTLLHWKIRFTSLVSAVLTLGKFPQRDCNPQIVIVR